MQQYTQLRAALLPYFSDLNKARFHFLVCFILGLIAAASVNLAKIAGFINDGTVDGASTYRRCQRFLAQLVIPYEMIAKAILGILNQKRFDLLIDRTDWKFRDGWINFLIISISLGRFAIPIGWINLSKRGNSNSDERLWLLKKILVVLGVEKINIIIGDREFCDSHFIKLLTEHNIHFLFRSKKSNTVKYKGESSRIENKFQGMKPGEFRSLPKKINLWGFRVYASCLMLKDGELLILISDVLNKRALAEYAYRWDAEVMHKGLKTNGFNLEDTHVQDVKRLEQLFGLAALALLIVYLAGERFGSDVKSICQRKFKDGHPQLSVFAKGWHIFERLFRGQWLPEAVLDGIFRFAPFLS
jgi:hypothetical protein